MASCMITEESLTSYAEKIRQRTIQHVATEDYYLFPEDMTTVTLHRAGNSGRFGSKTVKLLPTPTHKLKFIDDLHKSLLPIKEVVAVSYCWCYLGGIHNSDPWGVHWRVVVELRDEYVFFEPVLVQIGYVEANLEFNALAHAMMNKDRHARGNTIPSHYTRYHCSPAKMCDRHTKTITRVYGKQVPGSSTCNLHCIQFVINLLKKVRSGVSFFIKDCVPEEKEVYHLYCEDPSLCADPHPYTGTQHWDPKHV